MKIKQVVIVRAKKEVTDNAKKAVDKFSQMQSVRISLSSQTVNSMADKLESGEIDVVFIETNLDKAEINFLIGCIQRSKNCPVMICSTENYDHLQKVVPEDRIFNQKSEFSFRFIFNSIRNLLTPPNHKLDTRYMKSILMSVIGVIQQNTKINLIPKAISEIKQKEMPGDFVSAVTFYGDGFLGSFTVRTTRKLTNKFAQRIFFTEDENFDDDTLIDLLGEISNQILGVARNELKEFGYELRNSLQFVCAGEEFLYNTNSNGRYYEIPFSYNEESFNITFCYNTYQTSVHELGVEEENKERAKYDVRLVQTIEESIKMVWRNNVQKELKRTTIFNQKPQPCATSSIHVFHAAGWQGELTITLEIPATTLLAVFENMLGKPDGELEDSQLNDLAQELLNQVGGDFLKKTKEIGYTFMRIFQGSFCKQKGLHYMLKTPGFSSKLWFEFDGHPLIVSLGVRSDYCSSYYDSWPYLHQLPSFNDNPTIPASG